MDFSISLSGTPALIVIILFLGIPVWIVVMIISRLRRGAHKIHLKWDNIVMTEYEAPLSLTPAELGFISDSKFEKRELIATLLDLEQRGYLRIEKAKMGYEIVKVISEAKDLTEHERFVYESKNSGNDILNFISGDKKKFKKLVKQDLYDKGLIKKRFVNVSVLFSRIFIFWIGLNTLMSLYFIIHGFSSGEYIEGLFFFFLTPLFMAPIFIPISVIGGYIYNSVVGETSIWTKKMKSAWADVEGYKDFVKQVELDNIQFESGELKQKTKIKALPYAVAMGFNTEWQKRF